MYIPIRATKPDAPEPDALAFYVKSDGAYIEDENGTETSLSGGGGASQLTDLSDVSSATTTSGNVLIANGSTFASGVLAASQVAYTPTVNTDWDSDSDPGNVDDALDQLAERVDDLEGAGGGGVPTYYIGHYTPAFTSTTSTTFADINSTNIKQTVTLSGGETVKVRWFFANVSVTTGDAGQVRIVADDGSTNHTDDNTIVQSANLNANSGMLIECKFTGLAADTYDFTPQWKKNSSGSMQLTAIGVVSWCIEVYS